MRKITYTNPNGLSVVFGEGSRYSINDLQNLGTPEINFQEQQAPYQDGKTPIDQLMKSRDIPLIGIICMDGATASTYMNLLYGYRKTLCEALNPKTGSGEIKYENDNDTYVIYGIPRIVFKNNNSNNGSQQYLITFHCADPYWQDATDTVVNFVTGNTKQINILGDVASTVKIDINGIGYNPSMTETIQDKTLMIEKTISGEIEITTEFGNKKAVLKNVNDWELSLVNSYINDICYSEEYKPWIAVGATGSIIYSIDGLKWNFATGDSSSVYDMTGVAWSAFLSMWVAVGNNHIRYSYNGISWSTILLTSTFLIGVSWCSVLSQWVSVGNSIIKYSSDGKNWNDAIGVGSAILNKAVYGNSRWVAVGQSGVILTSTNGTSWSAATSGAATNLNNVSYSNTLNQFIAVGDSGVILYSTNGTSWSSATSGVSTKLKGITYDVDLLKWVAVGSSGVILYSTNGTAWSSATSGVSTELNGIAYSPSLHKLVVVGAIGTIIFSTNITLWVKSLIGINGGFSITYIEKLEKWFLGSYSRAYYSDDGKIWNDNGVTVVADGGIIYIEKLAMMIAWGVGVNNYYYSLDNGQTWTQRTIPETPPDYFYFYSVKWSDSLSLLVAVGSNHYDPIGQIFYSVDGLAWTQATINSNIERFNVVEWSDVQSKFVAIGVTPFSSSYNYSFTSADGKTWDRTNIPTIGQAIKSLIWVSYLGLWIAGCYQYGIYYSSDGDQWTAATGIMPGIAICWSQELKICLAVGVPADKRYATSKDGKNWILNTTTEYGSFDCAWSKKLSKFFVVGYQVSFLYSGDISENIIQFLSSNSTFYSLLPGTNVLSFQSGGGIFNGSVTYRNRYIGV